MISGTEIGIILYPYNRQSINGCDTVAKAVDLWDVHLLLSRQWINQCTSAVANGSGLMGCISVVAKTTDLWICLCCRQDN